MPKHDGRDYLELLIPDPTYDHPERDRPTFLADLRETLEELGTPFDLRDTDIGPAAGLPAILVVLSGLFFLGKPINENLDAWIALGRKFGPVVRRIATRFAEPRLDENGAVLLALCDLLDSLGDELRSVEIVARQTVPFWMFELRDAAVLDHHPDSLYILTLRVNNAKLFVFGIKSKGAIEFRHVYEASYLSF